MFFYFKGVDISVAGYFGFCRALSCSSEIKNIVGVRDWVSLLINMFDLSFLLHDASSGGNSFLVKVCCENVFLLYPSGLTLITAV